METHLNASEFARTVVLELAVAVLIAEHPRREAIQQRIRSQVQQALANATQLSDERRGELARASEDALRDIGL